jgi:hypothetical protein
MPKGRILLLLPLLLLLPSIRRSGTPSLHSTLRPSFHPSMDVKTTRLCPIPVYQASSARINMLHRELSLLLHLLSLLNRLQPSHLHPRRPMIVRLRPLPDTLNQPFTPSPRYIPEPPPIAPLPGLWLWAESHPRTSTYSRRTSPPRRFRTYSTSCARLLAHPHPPLRLSTIRWESAYTR